MGTMGWTVKAQVHKTSKRREHRRGSNRGLDFLRQLVRLKIGNAAKPGVFNLYAPVAQLNRVSGFYPVCWGFESLLGYQCTNTSLAQQDRVTGYEPVGREFESLNSYQSQNCHHGEFVWLVLITSPSFRVTRGLTQVRFRCIYRAFAPLTYNG